MGRADGLTEQEIVELEKKNATQLSMMVIRDGTSFAVETIAGLLRSYRATSAVANAAWRLVTQLDTGYAVVAELAILRKMLHRYAPEHFPPYRSDVAYAAWQLELLYNHLSAKNFATTPQVLEEIIEWCADLRSRPVVQD